MVEHAAPPETLRDFWIRVLAALSRAAALLLFVGVHMLLRYALRFVFPPSMDRMLLLADSIIGVLFLLVYIYLTWEMATVFVPGLKQRAYLLQRSVALPGEPEQKNGEV